MATGQRAVRELAGQGALGELGERLDDLHAASGAPITARRPWLTTWTSCYPDFQPWAIALDGAGRLDAVALLGRKRVGRRTEVVGLGHGPSDQTRLAARDGEAAVELGRAVAAAVRALPRPWRLRVEQLPVDDPAAATIASLLPGGRLIPGDGSPTTRFEHGGRSFNAYVGHNSRGVAKTMRNRIKRAGMDLEVDHIRDPERIVAALPEVEQVHRDRDLHLVRRSDLDDGRMAAFWRSIITELARRGEVELTTLRFSGRLAGYVVGVLDGTAYRLWDGRFDPEFSWFSPGRLADQSALAAALAGERFDEFDWMRGEEEYKLRTSTDVVPAQHLVAWSGALVRMRAESPQATKQALRRVRDGNRVLTRAWRAYRSRWLRRRTGNRPAGPRT
ncbi:MAG: GNAT family N-acetyltransferase [Actinomycetota bacterium]|nr:GNAT family N-acetyltransferase [Actinomycetota bacterium]